MMDRWGNSSIQTPWRAGKSGVQSSMSLKKSDTNDSQNGKVMTSSQTTTRDSAPVGIESGQRTWEADRTRTGDAEGIIH